METVAQLRHDLEYLQNEGGEGVGSEIALKKREIQAVNAEYLAHATQTEVT
jgi:hypothetical protein